MSNDDEEHDEIFKSMIAVHDFASHMHDNVKFNQKWSMRKVYGMYVDWCNKNRPHHMILTQDRWFDIFELVANTRGF